MRFLRSLFGKGLNEIKVGDLVEQYRHYEYDDTKGAILKKGPISDHTGTKWRFRGFGKYKYKLEPSIRQQFEQYGNFAEEEPVVELELIEGKFIHFVRFQESELPQKDSERLEILLDEKDNEELPGFKKVVGLPGYILRINSAIGYRKRFPKKSFVQQFFDEWRKI